MIVPETIAFKNEKRGRVGMKTIVLEWKRLSLIKNDRFGNNRLEIKPIVLEENDLFEMKTIVSEKKTTNIAYLKEN